MKSFNKKMFGLDEAEVTEYIEELTRTIKALGDDKESLKKSLKEKEMDLVEMKDRDESLQSAISKAAQMTERLRQDAEREAKFIIADAEQKAEMITQEAKDSLRKIYQEMADLKRTRLQFEANLKALAQAHLSLLEQGERYMPDTTKQSLFSPTQDH